jgi:N-methylhydantoinase A
MVVLDDPEHPVECPVYDRDKLPPGSTVTGPAIIWEYASTTVLLTGDVMTVADGGELIITIGANA